MWMQTDCATCGWLRVTAGEVPLTCQHSLMDAISLIHLVVVFGGHCELSNEIKDALVDAFTWIDKVRYRRSAPRHSRTGELLSSFPHKAKQRLPCFARSPPGASWCLLATGVWRRRPAMETP